MTEYEKERASWKRMSECRDIIRGYCKNISHNNMVEEMKKIYAYVKEVLPEYYIDAHVLYLHPAYEFLRNEVLICEQKLKGKFIVDSSPIFDFVDNMKINKDLIADNILNHVIHCVRKYLVLKYSLRKDRPVDIDCLDFENDCVIASNKVQKLCEQLGIESHIIGIYPGYDKHSELFYGNGFHMCNIVNIEGEYYLIDCTYRQFFTLKQNILERLGIVELSGVKAGRFMIMNDDRKYVADIILKNGWIKLTDEVLKAYLDGFTISFRNGLYYEKTGDFSYTTNYSVDDYIKFLRGEDSQLNHEDREVLGYQKKLLKNHKMTF